MAGLEAEVDKFYKSSKKTPTRIFPIFDSKQSKTITTTPTTAKKRKLSTRSPPSAVAAKKNRKRKLPLVESNKQYALDLGQKNFDASTCKKCHMVFTEGEFTDMEAHERYCSNYDKAKKWTVLKTERPFLAQYTTKDQEYRFFALPVHADDPKKILEKVDNLFTIADRELNINLGLFECKKQTSMYLIALAEDLKPKANKHATPSGDDKRKASPSYRVAGFVAAEGIKFANRLISENPLSHSTLEEPAVLGVARMWVHKDFRRMRVATFLLETLRKQYMTQVKMSNPRVIERRDIAFTDPTSEGLKFAQTYTGQRHFLVFTFQLENVVTTVSDAHTLSDQSNDST